MNLPRISIVTPSFNQARYIGWTVRSVFMQRYPNLEYILMDGGSTDATLDVLKPYAARFAHLVSEKDEGQSDALCRGFKRATGEILAYLNSDDMLAPDALHFVAQFFAENPGVDFIYSHRCTVDSENKVLSYWVLPRHSSSRMICCDLIPQETCFWRRSLFEKGGNVDPRYAFAMDYDLFVRYMKHGKFARVNRFLGAFRDHECGKTKRLYMSLGTLEVASIRKRLGIHAAGMFDKVRGKRFFFATTRAGSKYAAGKKVLPGALLGYGYDYDEVWGGLLNESTLPPS